MGATMSFIEQLAVVGEKLQNSYVTDWLNQGRKVMGYVCTYVPEELFYAADILPFRITGRGVEDTSRADAYLTRVNCSFCRCLLELGFEGEYEFLEGAVFMNGCDHIRRAYDNWEAHNTARPFMYMLPIPHRITDRGLEWYKEEVTGLKEAIESHFRVKITSDRLAEATRMCNETRRLLRKLYDLRAGDDPPLTGAEALTVTSAATAMPKKEFNRMLGQLLEEIESRPKTMNGKLRLFISGSLMDDPELIENVEDLGAVVVSDALCFGARNFWTLTDEEGDPFDALCERYYYHEPCPRMAGEYSQRLAFAKEQIERARADGAILEAIKFCDMHGTDNALMKFHLEKEGVPVIELERQYGPLTDAGRIRTRVQAFLERIGR
jgi:bzd-type benzoyl-CoA reductase N subunit